jgi:ABC-type polysaccharide/polyol phosphate export permease
MFSKSINDMTRGIGLYRVWLHQAYHEISSKYRRTILGSVWISGAMVATSLALAVVMGGLQGQSLPEALPYVMAGIMCFTLTGTYILNEAPEVYMSSANIIKNHAYPYTYYSFESVSRSFIVFFHNVIALFVALAILGRLSVPHWSVLPALLVVFGNGVVWGSLSSMVAARFRDLRFLLPFVGQMVFFLTPVFWHPSNMTGWRAALVHFNPFYGLVEILRSPLLGAMAPMLAWQQAGISLALGGMLWLVFFGAFRGKIAFWV